MNGVLKLTLIGFAVLAVLFGAPLLVAPGRFLGTFGWAPVDPLISRMLGAALLGYAWLSLRSWRANSRDLALPLIESGAIFCGLAAIGIIRNMIGAGWPFMVWFVLGIYIVLAALWILNRVKR
jgi:hypothetical protein